MSVEYGTVITHTAATKNSTEVEMTVSVWTDDQHDAWYRLGARMGDLVETLSGRFDLTVRISPDLRPVEVRRAAPVPAAFFTPAQARTTFNASAVLREHMDDPDTIDPCDSRDQARHPELIGAAIHESAHAAHTRLSFPKGTSQVAAKWATLLEESRCEKRALERRPQDAAMLRVSTHSLVANGALHAEESADQEQGTMARAQAARASLLLLARVDTDVLIESDVTALREKVVDALGQDTLDALREVWLSAQNLGDDEREALIACGQRVQDILDNVEPEPEPEPQEGEPEQGESDDSEQGQDQGDSEGEDSDKGEPQSGENGAGQGSSTEPSGETDDQSGSEDQGEGEGQGEGQGQDSEESDGGNQSNEDGESDQNEDENAAGGSGNEDQDDESDDKSNRANAGGDRPEDEQSGNEDQGEGVGSGDSQKPSQDEAQRDQNGSDGKDKTPSEDADDAFRMPCGSWTEGDLPEDAQDAIEAPQGEVGDLERAAQAGTAEGAQEARRQIAAAAGIVLVARNARAERAAERAETTRAAQQVFSPTGGTKSVRITVREEAPDAPAQRMSRQLGQAIKAAQFRDVTRTRMASQTPPGRLNIREAAARSAQISRGESITATPWSQTRRRMVENPPLTVGIAVDVSMSMDSWQRPVSTFAWSLSKAVRDLAGTVAVTAWNGTNTAIMHPGRGQRNMKIISCGGGSSGCPTALDALDGALGLCDGEGVRVAVVVTDGELPNMAEVQVKANRLKRHGVILLWVITSMTRGQEVQGAVNIRLNGPGSFANIVSQHITRALNAA